MTKQQAAEARRLGLVRSNMDRDNVHQYAVGFLEAVMAFLNLARALAGDKPIPDLKERLDAFTDYLQPGRTWEFAAAIEIVREQLATGIAASAQTESEPSINPPKMPNWRKHPKGTGAAKGSDTTWTLKLDGMKLRVQRKKSPSKEKQRGYEIVFEGDIDGEFVIRSDSLLYAQNAVWVRAVQRLRRPVAL